MRISLVGGIDRLQKHYLQEAKNLGVELRIFNTSENDLSAKLGSTEVVLLFTSKVSHTARRQVMGAAHAKNIPVFQSHNCGICALRDCLACVVAAGTEMSTAKGKRPLIS